MEIVKAALPPQQQREALLLGKYWTPATAFEARVVDQVAPTPEAAVAAACGLVCSLPAQAAFAYSVNKAYLHRPFLADMVGESYDQFVNACYTPEAQVARPFCCRRSHASLCVYLPLTQGCNTGRPDSRQLGNAWGANVAPNAVPPVLLQARLQVAHSLLRRGPRGRCHGARYC